jgi:hypothetical protein
MLRVAFTASAGLTDPLVQVVRVGAGPTIRDIHRFDSTTYSKTIRVGPQVEAVLVIVATRDTGGSFQLDVTEVASASDAMITRWNTAAGREYEIDPRGWAWTWISPDVMVDNDGDGLADPEVFFDRDNVLKVRLRNRGNAAANNVRVDLWYQKATPYLSAAAWIPLRNDAGAIQSVGPVSLAPGTSDWFAVAWAPADDGTHHPHWCVKARITAPGDANTDNKLALSNFSRVVVDPDGDRVDADILLRRPERHRELDVLTVPRGRWRLIKKSISGPPPEVRDEPCLAVAGHSVSDLGTPTRSAWARLVFGRDPGARPWDGSAETLPQPGVFYPVDPESLPPGVDPEELVTVVQRIDGVTVGGVTYALGPSARGPRRAD